MKLIGIFRKVIGTTEYGRKVGRTAENGANVYKKIGWRKRTYTLVDAENNVKKIVQKNKSGIVAQDSFVKVDNTIQFVETTVDKSKDKKIINRDVLRMEKVFSEDGSSNTHPIKWLEQSKTVINDKGDVFTVKASAERPTGKGAEHSRLLNYERYPLATKGWWQWFVNGKSLPFVDFLSAKTDDIIRLI